MNIVDIQNLSKSYGNKQALKNVTLSVPLGKIVGLLGPNGSGKTTMIKILTGLISDYTGSILIENHTPGPYANASVSYLPDRTVLPTQLTVQEAINYYNDFYQDFDIVRAQEMLSGMGIDKSKRIKTLSKGMIEKLQLGLVMSRKAKLYVLDEPIAAVDPASRDFIIRTIIQNFGGESSLFISTHLISDIEPVLDYAIFLREGEITLYEEAENIRQRTGQSIDQLFRGAAIFCCNIFYHNKLETD